MKRVAVRNIRLCTKDCLCLYVCPTGASDTENSIIDVNKCIGCESCFKACPSGAISMVNVEYPKQQKKANVVVNALNEMALNKSKGEYLAREIAKATDKKTLATLMLAISKSERLIAEDIEREAGFMLPQSDNAHKMLEGFLKDETLENLPKDTIKELLHLIPNNERKGEETIMAKWKCKVCGYIHEGNKAPDVCPVCMAPASEFEEVKEPGAAGKKGLNRDSNVYTVVYAAVMVLVVAVLLAFTSQSLKSAQKANEDNDKRQQILRSINVSVPANEAEAKFNELIKEGFLINANGEELGQLDAAFADAAKDREAFPVFVANVNGEKKYILQLYGAGLWGPIWGYISVNADKNTVYGTDFSHASETPGLGAEITKPAFSTQFAGKQLFKDGAFKSIAVVKKGKSAEGQDYVDGISGGTITSQGVDKMLLDCLSGYSKFLTSQN